MPAELPYMPTAGNLAKILGRIREAATPPKFTHEFLKSNLGFGSSNDRAALKVLKQLGFITNDGSPTARYNEFRGPKNKKALAQGLREGWSELFLSDENIYRKSGEDLIGVVKNTTGAGDAVARKISSTFKALAQEADFSEPSPPKPPEEVPEDQDDGDTTNQGRDGQKATGRNVSLHHDIHVHLPPTSDVAVYRAIFQAMKSELL